MNEKLIQNISKTTKDLKRNSQLISETLIEDNGLIDDISKVTNDNLNMIKKGNKMMNYEMKGYSNYILFIIFIILFFLSYFIIKIFPK